MKRTKDKLITYFQEIVDRIIYPEIERCIKADAKYVAALALLSYTEFIGALVNGHLGSRGTSESDFKTALQYFPSEYQDRDSKLKVEYLDENNVTQIEEGIYHLFRCGLAHESLIKGDYSTIFNDPNGQADPNRIGVGVFTLIQERVIAFYVNEYFRDFRLAVEKIRKQLFTDSDPGLLKNYDRGLARIYSRRVL